MPLIIFENNSNGTLATSIDNVTTSISLVAGQGANFPSVTAPNEIFFITLHNYAAQLVEICRVTDRVGDALTVLRGQDGTTGLNWAVADTAIQSRVTKETLEAFIQSPQTWEYFTATESQAAFNTAATLPATDDRVQTFINGVRQFPPSHFTVTGNQQLTFTEGLAEGDYVAIGI